MRSHAVGESVSCGIGICNFTASLSSSTWELVLEAVTGIALQRRSIGQNEASKKSLAVSRLTDVVIFTPSISCEVIYLFTFLAESPLRSWISRGKKFSGSFAV